MHTTILTHARLRYAFALRVTPDADPQLIFAVKRDDGWDRYNFCPFCAIEARDNFRSIEAAVERVPGNVAIQAMLVLHKVNAEHDFIDDLIEIGGRIRREGWDQEENDDA